MTRGFPRPVPVSGGSQVKGAGPHTSGATLKIPNSTGLEKASCSVEPKKARKLSGVRIPSPAPNLTHTQNTTTDYGSNLLPRTTEGTHTKLSRRLASFSISVLVLVEALHYAA